MGFTAQLTGQTTGAIDGILRFFRERKTDEQKAVLEYIDAIVADARSLTSKWEEWLHQQSIPPAPPLPEGFDAYGVRLRQIDPNVGGESQSKVFARIRVHAEELDRILKHEHYRSEFGRLLARVIEVRGTLIAEEARMIHLFELWSADHWPMEEREHIRAELEPFMRQKASSSHVVSAVANIQTASEELAAFAMALRAEMGRPRT